MPTAEVQKFFELLRRGDREQVEALLRRLELPLRKIIRLRLVDGRLRRIIDTNDILQSLLKDFLSQKEGNRPISEISAGLYAYLAAAVHHKIKTRARKEAHVSIRPIDDINSTSPEPAVAVEVDNRDYFDAVRSRLSEPTRRLFDLYVQGMTWADIASQTGEKADTLRIRLTRQIAKIRATID